MGDVFAKRSSKMPFTDRNEAVETFPFCSISRPSHEVRPHARSSSVAHRAALVHES
jgi:hypothetical protein